MPSEPVRPAESVASAYERGWKDARVKQEAEELPEMVSTGLSICVTHAAIHPESLKWRDCQFRELFYFANPMDQHTYEWSDDPDWVREPPVLGNDPAESSRGTRGPLHEAMQLADPEAWERLCYPDDDRPLGEIGGAQSDGGDHDR